MRASIITGRRATGLLATVLTLLVFTGPLVGQISDAPVLKEIQFEGLRSISEETLQYYLRLRTGEPLDRMELDRAIRQLWERDLLDDIVVDAEPVEGGVRLTVRVEERPLLQSIEYEGLKKVSRSDVSERVDKDHIQIREGLPLERGELERLKGAIRDLFEEKGFRFAQVEERIEEDRPGEVRVILTVDEGDRVRIDDIVFEGNTVFSDMRLRFAMKKTKQSNIVTRLMKKDIFNEGTVQEDLDAVRDMYREKGYKEVLIGDPEIVVRAKKPDAANVKDQKRRLFLTIPVEEGARWRLGEITIAGNEVYSDELLLRMFERPKGDWLKSSMVDEGVENVKKLYDNSGYIFSTVDTELKDREEQVADLVVNVDEGDQYRVGRMEFEGNTRTRDKVLRREFRVQEGLLLNMGALQSSIYKIRQLEYFKLDEENPIEFENFDREEKTVDLKIAGEESDRTELLFGGGWSEFDGFFGQFQMRTRNFLGRGETVAVSLQAGSVRNVFDVSYYVPWLFDRPQSAGVQLFRRDYDYDYLDNQNLIRKENGVVLTYGRNLGLFQQASISYSLSDIKDKRILAGGEGEEDLVQEYKLKNSSIRPMWVLDSRDSRIEPTRGMRIAASLEYAGGFLGGTNWFWRPEAGFSMYRPVTVKPLKTVLGFNVEAGWIEPFGGKPISPLELFYIGGDNSVRGFRTRTISVRDDDGNLVFDPSGFVLGGSKFIELNLEYHFLVGGPFRVVLFGDAGNVYAEYQSLDFSNMRYSAGVELRVFVPVFGLPLRFIYATNLDPLPGDRFEKFQFSVGSAF